MYYPCGCLRLSTRTLSTFLNTHSRSHKFQISIGCDQGCDGQRACVQFQPKVTFAIGTNHVLLGEANNVILENVSQTARRRVLYCCGSAELSAGVFDNCINVCNRLLKVRLLKVQNYVGNEVHVRPRLRSWTYCSSGRNVV